MAASEGITAEKAWERLDLQANLARIAVAVAPTLDRARTAGLYIDAAAGELVVTATAPGASGPRREHVREAPVRYSSDDLDEAAAAVTAAAESTAASGVTWVVDVRANAVVVAVDTAYADVPSAQALRARVATLGPLVRMRTRKTIESSADDVTIAEPSGREVAAGDGAGGCSVAWPVRDRGGNDGILTAGHCIDGDGEVWLHAGRSLGRAAMRREAPWDFGVIRHDPSGGAKLGVKVNLYDGSYATLAGHSFAPVGSVVCKSGAASRLTCGTITAERLSKVNNGSITGDLVGVRMCSDYGDSGGAVFVPYADGTVTALGIVTGGVEACHPVLGEGDDEIIDNGTWYQRIDTVLSEHALTLRLGPLESQGPRD
jgi:hypothetical protein